jgi:hypothetical protein
MKSEITTEAEPTGGVGGLLEFYHRWPQFPKDFIIPGKVYCSSGKFCYLIDDELISDLTVNLPPKYNFSEVLLAKPKKWNFFALSGSFDVFRRHTKERFIVFRALFQERLICVVLDIELQTNDLSVGLAINLRKSVNNSISLLDDPDAVAKLVGQKENGNEDYLDGSEP